MIVRAEEGTNIAIILAMAKKELRKQNIESWALDADLLMMEAAALTRTELVTKGHRILDEVSRKYFYSMLNRRLLNEPVQYIINRCEFMGLEFYVDKHVLIPRPDTEYAVETALDYIKEKVDVLALDMCTGSGCIAVSLAFHSKNIKKVYAADISINALNIAKINSEKNNVDSKVEFLETDMFQRLPEERYDVIISNPPYIETEEISCLLKNVKEYEPVSALDGGKDGLDFYHSIALEAHKYLKADGHVILEIGYNQKEAVKTIFIEQDYQFLECRKDIAGLDRVMVFSK